MLEKFLIFTFSFLKINGPATSSWSTATSISPQRGLQSP